jgi:hypothetical protein
MHMYVHTHTSYYFTIKQSCEQCRSTAHCQCASSATSTSLSSSRTSINPCRYVTWHNTQTHFNLRTIHTLNFTLSSHQRNVASDRATLALFWTFIQNDSKVTRPTKGDCVQGLLKHSVSPHSIPYLNIYKDLSDWEEDSTTFKKTTQQEDALGFQRSKRGIETSFSTHRRRRQLKGSPRQTRYATRDDSGRYLITLM